MLRQLVCPWLVIAQTIPLKFPFLRENHLLLLSDDGQRMYHHVEYTETATMFCPRTDCDSPPQEEVDFSTVKARMPVMSERIRSLSLLAVTASISGVSK
jgi:hypothetical protein